MNAILPAVCPLCNSSRWCGRNCAQAKHVTKPANVTKPKAEGFAPKKIRDISQKAASAAGPPADPETEEAKELKMARKRKSAVKRRKAANKAAKRVTKKRLAAVTKKRQAKRNGVKRGRPPIGRTAMTDAERARRYRERKASAEASA